VTASKATSSKTKAHSKKAYVVYADNMLGLLKRIGSRDLTTCNLMYLMLNEEVYKRYEGTEKGACKIFSILYSFSVAWA
jgi:hypothetical protein